MEVEVRWQALGDGDDQAWGWTFALYAYLSPKDDEILYIGKADGSTVRARWNADDKEAFWGDLEEERGITHHIPIVGEVSIPDELDDDEFLLTDVESLLIIAEQPWGNIKCKESRTTRPGLVVICRGEWPGKYSEYLDEEL